MSNEIFVCVHCSARIVWGHRGEWIDGLAESACSESPNGFHSASAVFSNGLSPAEDERLAILMEELAEAVQVIGKIHRHGYESRNPLIPESPTNRELLEAELGHVRHAIERMTHESAGDLDEARIARAQSLKAWSIKRWLHHQPEHR